MFLFSLTACVSNKNYIYLQNKSVKNDTSSQFIKTVKHDYLLQAGDILYINLSSDDERLSKIFLPNSGMAQGQMMQGGGSGTPFYFTGFTLNSAGELELPYIGKVKLAGKDIEAAKALLETEFSKYFKVYFLTVKLAEFKFSIIGNVGHSGQYFFMQNSVNIIEALAMSGDVTDMGKRNRIMLLRQYPEGIKTHYIDLTDKSLLTSQFFYLQNHDIIYVEPLRVRQWGAVTNVQGSLSLFVSIVSTLLVGLNTYYILKNLK